MAKSLKDLVAEIAAGTRWRLDPDEQGFTFVVPQGKGRKQKVSLELVTYDAMPLVRITSIIGPRARLTPDRFEMALALNYHLPYGCLALTQTDLVITETRPLKTTTPSTTGEAVRYIARQADLYEAQIFKQDKN